MFSFQSKLETFKCIHYVLEAISVELNVVLKTFFGKLLFKGNKIQKKRERNTISFLSKTE